MRTKRLRSNHWKITLAVALNLSLRVGGLLLPHSLWTEGHPQHELRDGAHDDKGKGHLVLLLGDSGKEILALAKLALGRVVSVYLLHIQGAGILPHSDENHGPEQGERHQRAAVLGSTQGNLCLEFIAKSALVGRWSRKDVA